MTHGATYLATITQINEDLLRNKYAIVDHLSLAQCAGFAGSSFTEVQHIWRDLQVQWAGAFSDACRAVMEALRAPHPDESHAINLTLNMPSSGSSFYSSCYSENHRLLIVPKPNTSNPSSNEGSTNMMLETGKHFLRNMNQMWSAPNSYIESTPALKMTRI